MGSRKRANPRLRRAWNKRPKYLPSFHNWKEYQSFHVTAGVNAKELMRGEPVMWHDTLLMLKRLGGFHQGIDKWHQVKMPWLSNIDMMFFTGNQYVFYRNVDGLITRTCVFQSKEEAEKSYRSNRLHWFLPYDREEKTDFKDPLGGLKPHPRPRPIPKEED